MCLLLKNINMIALQNILYQVAYWSQNIDISFVFRTFCGLPLLVKSILVACKECELPNDCSAVMSRPPTSSKPLEEGRINCKKY